MINYCLKLIKRQRQFLGSKEQPFEIISMHLFISLSRESVSWKWKK